MEPLQQAEIVDRIIFDIEKNYLNMNCLNDLHTVLLIECPIYEEIFQQQVNLAIDEYIDRLRVEKAVQLLEETQLDVKDIATAVGINGYFEFAHIFKEITGISPSDYQHQLCREELIK